MSESIGARISRESFEKHQREIRSERLYQQSIAQEHIDKLQQRIASLAEILLPQLTYANGSIRTRLTLTEPEAREVKRLLEGT